MKDGMRSEHGVVILFTLWALVGLILMVQVTLTRSLTDLQATNRFLASQQALHLAEGRVDDVLKRLADNPGLATGSGPVPCPAGPAHGLGEELSCTITPPTAGLGDISVQWASPKAAAPLATQQVTATVQFGNSKPFQWAAFGDVGVTLTSDAGRVDYYNSNEGPYVWPPPDTGGGCFQGAVSTWIGIR